MLQQAQELGYAEADPTFDVEGIDAAHNLTIMSAIAFAVPRSLRRPIPRVLAASPGDIGFAEELGYRIKHLGIARKRPVVEMQVHPTLDSNTRLLANVNGVGNAVMVQEISSGRLCTAVPAPGRQQHQRWSLI